MDRAETAAGLWDRVVDQVAALGQDDWHRPTPCAGWDVHDLVGHLSGVQVAFDSRRVEPVPEGWAPDPGLAPLDAATAAVAAARADWMREQLVAELSEARDGHVARLAAVEDWEAPTEGPLGPTTEDGLFRVRMFDVWVHLQDLRAALGEPVEAEDISPAAAVAHRYVWDRVPWLVAKRVGAPEGWALHFALGPPLDLDAVVAVRGGRAVVEPDGAAGDSAVRGAPAALTLLAAGRGDPSSWRADRLLDWEGDRGETFVARARLFAAPAGAGAP